jgi:flagellar hook-associated protein 1
MMNLSAAFSLINSAFATNAAQSAVVARNVANVSVAGYSREVANLMTNGLGDAEVQSVTRVANAALSDQALTSTSAAASQQAISDGLSTLAQTVDDSASSSSVSGANTNGRSPSAMLANLQNALQTYEVSPSDKSLGQAVVTAADNLASSLNSASATVEQVRQAADTKMASAVAQNNSLLGQFQSANTQVVAGLHTNANVAGAEDQRDQILTQLARQVGVSTTTDANGSMSIYTDSGVTLFQDTPRTLTFAASSSLTAGASGAPVLVDGVPITGSSSPMAIQSGALAGLAALRDNIAPQYQAQLDQIAGGLIQAFSESDQSATPSQPDLPGLFTLPGATGVPSLGSATGLAAAIEVNPSADPAQGGNVSLLRDGGIASDGAAPYAYNSTSDAGYTGRIQMLIDGIGAV